MTGLCGYGGLLTGCLLTCTVDLLLNREAELGCNVCDTCGFENFKRVRFCNVCGEPVGEDAEKRVRKIKTANELSGRRLRVR